jgi:hypothetical protein
MTKRNFYTNIVQVGMFQKDFADPEVHKIL